jgi:hypothetical protein
MDDTRVIRLYSFGNTLGFPSEETSLGRGGFPHISQFTDFKIIYLFKKNSSK